MCCLNIPANSSVLWKNKTINEELSECLREFQQHIPDDSHTILVGVIAKGVPLWRVLAMCKSGVFTYFVPK